MVVPDCHWGFVFLMCVRKQVTPHTNAMQVFFKCVIVKLDQTQCGRAIQVMGMS